MEGTSTVVQGLADCTTLATYVAVADAIMPTPPSRSSCSSRLVQPGEPATTREETPSGGATSLPLAHAECPGVTIWWPAASFLGRCPSARGGTYIHTHTYIHTYIHTCIHTYIHTCIHTQQTTHIKYIDIYMHTYIHTHNRICI